MAKANRRIVKKQKAPRNFSWAKNLWKYIRLTIVTSALLSALGVVGFYSVQFTQQFLNRPISSVAIEGQFNYVDKATIAVIVESMIGDSFVGENIDVIKHKLHNISWVDDVLLSRQWPDRLQVVITEQVPIARWGDDSFINVRGELIQINDNAVLAHLSKLSGKKEDAQQIMREYAMLTNVFQPYGLAVKQLEKSQRGVWKLHLDNEWNVVLGQGNIFSKIQRLTHLFDKKILDKTADIDTIDIRYPNGLAVQWGVATREKMKMNKDNNTPEKLTMRYTHDTQYIRG